MRSKSVKVGDGMQPGVTMGPVISARHRERVLAYIERASPRGQARWSTGAACKVEA